MRLDIHSVPLEQRGLTLEDFKKAVNAALRAGSARRKAAARCLLKNRHKRLFIADDILADEILRLPDVFGLAEKIVGAEQRRPVRFPPVAEFFQKAMQ